MSKEVKVTTFYAGYVADGCPACDSENIHTTLARSNNNLDPGAAQALRNALIKQAVQTFDAWLRSEFGLGKSDESKGLEEFVAQMETSVQPEPEMLHLT